MKRSTASMFAAVLLVGVQAQAAPVYFGSTYEMAGEAWSIGPDSEDLTDSFADAGPLTGEVEHGVVLPEAYARALVDNFRVEAWAGDGGGSASSMAAINMRFAAAESGPVDLTVRWRVEYGSLLSFQLWEAEGGTVLSEFSHAWGWEGGAVTDMPGDFPVDAFDVVHYDWVDTVNFQQGEVYYLHLRVERMSWEFSDGAVMEVLGLDAVATPVPTPTAYAGGAVLFGMLGLVHWLRKRRLAAGGAYTG